MTDDEIEKLASYAYHGDSMEHCRYAIRKALESRAAPEAGRKAVIEECRTVVLACSDDAHEAAKAKDATDYVAGYQDAVVDCDEALRALLPQEER